MLRDCDFDYRLKQYGGIGRSKCDLSKLRNEGFEFKYELKEILSESIEFAKRLGVL